MLPITLSGNKNMRHLANRKAGPQVPGLAWLVTLKFSPVIQELIALDAPGEVESPTRTL